MSNPWTIRPPANAGARYPDSAPAVADRTAVKQLSTPPEKEQTPRMAGGGPALGGSRSALIGTTVSRLGRQETTASCHSMRFETVTGSTDPASVIGFPRRIATGRNASRNGRMEPSTAAGSGRVKSNWTVAASPAPWSIEPAQRTRLPETVDAPQVTTASPAVIRAAASPGS
jgi:hypothetical protein